MVLIREPGFSIHKRWLEDSVKPLEFYKIDGKKKSVQKKKKKRNKLIKPFESNKVEKKEKKIQKKIKWVKGEPFKFEKVVKKEKNTDTKNKKKKRKKKKKKKCDNGRFIHETISTEILSRLPVESLMRFKSVCKRWCYLIEQDTIFIDLHRSRSKQPRLFIVVPQPGPSSITQFSLVGEINFLNMDFVLTADFYCERSVSFITTVCKTSSWFYNSISKPVNGLICFIDPKAYHSVRIYNIGTKQVTPWIKSIVLPKEKEKNIIDDGLNWFKGSYQLGFDPCTKENKLVCVGRISRKGGRPTDYNVCEVLTVGNNTWRMIEDVPPYALVGSSSIYVNGSIYWITNAVIELSLDNKDNPACVVAFDIGSEKFRTITIPDFVFNEPVDHYKDDTRRMRNKPDPYAYLIQVGGRVALLIRTSDSIVKLWIFEDDDKINGEMNTNINWNEVTITLPFGWERNRRVYFHTIEGIDDEIIIRTCEHGQWRFDYYFYDWKKKKFKDFEIRGTPCPIYDLVPPAQFATFVETLTPVNPSI